MSDWRDDDQAILRHHFHSAFRLPHSHFLHLLHRLVEQREQGGEDEQVAEES